MFARKPAFAAILLVLVFLLTGCSDDDNGTTNPGTGPFEATGSDTYSFFVDTERKLSIDNLSGSVTIVGSDGFDSIRVEIVTKVRSTSQTDANSRLDDFDIDITNFVNDSLLLIESDHPSSTGDVNYTVEFTITVPSDMVIEVVQAAGAVSITNIDNTIGVNVVAGNVTMTGTNAPITGTITSGSFTVSATLPINNNIVLGTTTGSINLTIPTSTNADFSATVVTGSINTTNLTLTNQASSATTLTGVLGSGAGNIVLTTVTGSIQVTGS